MQDTAAASGKLTFSICEKINPLNNSSSAMAGTTDEEKARLMQSLRLIQ
jgi:hypothetical protein